MVKDKRINGEYDPSYSFNENPSAEERAEAQKIIDKYTKKLNEKQNSGN